MLLKCFHKLVDKRLDGDLSSSEQAELQALEAAFDEADVAIIAQKQQWEEQNAQVLQIEQLDIRT